MRVACATPPSYDRRVLDRIGQEDPFSALGLHPFESSAQDVRAAFRRLAIELHPDKRGGQEGSVSFSFSRLVELRDRALEMIDERPPPWQWAVWLASALLSATTAATLEIPLEVELADLHCARVKKVCISVNRVSEGDAEGDAKGKGKRRQTLFVRLVCPSRHAMIDRVEFPGLGDDPPADVFLGRRQGRRGDVVVVVRVAEHPTYMPDPVLYPCDLHANVAVSLVAFYAGERFRLPHPSGRGEEEEEEVVVEFPATGLGEVDADAVRNGRVVAIEGMGLPFAGPESGTLSRGTLYVFFRVALPTLRDPSEIDRLRAWPPGRRID